MTRSAQIARKTNETAIHIELALDGRGESSITTKIPFFDHMLTLFARHSLVNLTVQADGDIEVDLHHTVEDTWHRARAGDRESARGQTRHPPLRLGLLPMDETLARVVIDFSGRPFLEYHAPQNVAPGWTVRISVGRRIPARLFRPRRREFARRNPLRSATRTTWLRPFSKASRKPSIKRVRSIRG
jgi:imidazoleglycerol phosphate dehydratase HisB